MDKHKSNKIKENSNTVRHLIMGQITTTQNLVAIKDVRHAGQQQITTATVITKYLTKLTSQHWLRKWLGVEQATSHCQNQGWPNLLTYVTWPRCVHIAHNNDVIMTTMASQITSLTVVYSTFYSDADQRKHQSSASLAFVWGIHRDRWIPHTKGQLRGKCFHLMTSSWVHI